MKVLILKLAAVFLFSLLTVLTGCDDLSSKPGVEFKNKSTYDVTVYWSRYSYYSYHDSFVLSPGEENQIDADVDLNNGDVYYDWEPKNHVKADAVEKDVVEFVDR